MNRSKAIFQSALVGVLWQAAIAWGDPKVVETVVGPATTDVVYVVSPAGGHVAAGMMKGSRYVVAVDGVEGPVFDAVMNVTSAAAVVSPADPAAGLPGYTPKPVSQTPVVFSEDGKRYAYLARSGQEYVVIVDGKEQRRFSAAPGLQVRMQFVGPAGQKHVMTVAGVSGLFDVFVDGQPLPPHDPNVVPVYSKDGSRFAYVATPNAQERAKTVLVVDGKTTDYAADAPRFTADGKHLLAMGHAGDSQTLLVDGQPVVKAMSIPTVFVAPAGDKFVTVISKPAPGAARYVCVIDGKEVAATEGTEPPFVAFSPDGRRWAARCKATQGAAVSWIVTDEGKKGTEYVGIDDNSVTFSADGSRLAYVASNNSKFFAIIDGKESDGFNAGLKVGFSPDGKQAYYGGQQQTTPITRVLYIEDKPYRGDHNFNNESIAFNANGTRWGALGSGLKSGGPTGLQAVENFLLDGKLVEGFTVANFTFTPDGSHVAFLGQRRADGANGLFLDDGKPLKLDMGTRGRPVKFSPDGKHLFWTTLQTDRTTNRPIHVVYADGKAVAHFDNVALGNFETDPGAWQVAADGTLSAVGVVGDKVMCYRVTTSDTDVSAAAADFVASEAKTKADAAAAQQAAADTAAKKKADAEAAAKKQQEDAAVARQQAIDNKKAAAAEKLKLRQDAAAAKKKAAEDAAAARKAK
ncbi:MAG: hypothetical protein JWM57_3616 [Phycisphaerales bacterium]|nr:hypothetical protein [Phycisphaerales bacterium]